MYLERVQAREERKAASMADEETGTGTRGVAMASGGAAEEKKKVFFVFDKPSKAGEFREWGKPLFIASPGAECQVVWISPDQSIWWIHRGNAAAT